MDELTHLLLAARDGDRGKLGELIASSQPDVWRFCASMVGVDSADDVTQDTFVRVWRSARTFRAEASAKTWILAIARRACADALRQRGRRPAPTPDPTPAPSADHSDGVALRELVDQLEPDRRSAFVLTQVVGLPYLDAAQVCGCPVGTIRSRVARARADLIAQIGSEPVSTSTVPAATPD